MSPSSYILVLVGVTRWEPARGIDKSRILGPKDSELDREYGRAPHCDCQRGWWPSFLDGSWCSPSRRWRATLYELQVECLLTSPSFWSPPRKGSRKLNLNVRRAKENSNSNMPASRTRRVQEGHVRGTFDASWEDGLIREDALLEGETHQGPQELWSTILNEGESTMHHATSQDDDPVVPWTDRRPKSRPSKCEKERLTCENPHKLLVHLNVELLAGPLC